MWSNHFESTFHDEDYHVILKNRAIQNLGNIPAFFTTPVLYADRPEYAQYRPLALVSLAIDYSLATPVNATVFDIDGFAWFLLEIVLFCGLCAAIPGSTWKSALLATAIFAFHPLAGETLNYASHRGDIEGAVALVAAMAFRIVWPRYLPDEIMHWQGVPKTDWDDFRRRWSPRVNRAYRRLIEAPLGLYMIPVILGMLADPGAAVFPLLLLAYILLFDRQRGSAPVWRRVLPSAAICAAFWFAQLAFTWKYANGFRLPAVSYWLTQPWAVVRYFVAFIAPVHLTPESGLKAFTSLLSPEALAGFLGLGGLVALALWAGRYERWRPAAFGLWWFLIALLPAMLVPQRAAESDTRVYIAMLGLALAAARAGSLIDLKIAARWSNQTLARLAGPGVAVLVVGTLCVVTFERNEIWKSELMFWEDATKKSPENVRAFVEYGAALNATDQTDRGYASLLHAASLIGNDAPDQVALAEAFDLAGKDKEAELHFKRALEANPGYANAWSAYGQWLIVRRRSAEAYQAALKAIQISPWNVEAGHTLLQYYLDNSDWQNLRQTAEAVLRVDPTDAQARRSATLAQAAFDAVQLAEEKARTQSGVDDYLALSVQYYKMRRFRDSVEASRNALKINPNLAEAYSNIAAAYHANGQDREAIQALREAIRIRPDLQVARQNLNFLMSLQAEGGKPAPQ